MPGKIPKTASIPALLEQLQKYCRDSSIDTDDPESDGKLSLARAREGAKWAERYIVQKEHEKWEVVYIDPSRKYYAIVEDKLAHAAGNQETLDCMVGHYLARVAGDDECMPWINFQDFKTTVENIYLIDRAAVRACTCYKGRDPPCKHVIATTLLEGMTLDAYGLPGVGIEDLLSFGPKARGRPRLSKKKALEIDPEYQKRGEKHFHGGEVAKRAASSRMPHNARRVKTSRSNEAQSSLVQVPLADRPPANEADTSQLSHEVQDIPLAKTPSTAPKRIEPVEITTDRLINEEVGGDSTAMVLY
ncbi:hypothetical protein FOZ63_033164 [Perkinsus olseni]|uniref:SWIM-type domain-containing protein n=1 Tax=Perkinsus olseni TaxID=32597 RepID=A0A7J6S1Y7_PEROL|nr:hypothetical protein FOZ63_033164 [Perkinsus olseni]